jgi:uncharacterized repeat protein (TIGR01451 family)
VIAGLLATFVSIALLPCGVAAADTVKTEFEAPLFGLGSVNGQDGWKSATPFDIPSLPHGYDQAVVANSGAPAAFGGQSLRLSNAYNPAPGTSPPEYHFQTYSKPTVEAAGDSLANTEYTAQFSFISTKPDLQQHRLLVSLSPDEGEGGRMSYIGLEDTEEGIEVIFYDTPQPDGEFAEYELPETLARDVPHTIKFWMKLNPGPNNDLVRIYIDNHDVGQCFTTWENFYRASSQPVPTSDTLLFLSGGKEGDIPSLVGNGFLFDNVTITTGKGPGPPGCDVPIEKKADAHTVRPGGRVGYRITARNRGPLAARNVLVCDHFPREMTFVSADRKLLRRGHRRCLLISRLAPGQRVSFHLVLQLDANAPPGTESNIAEEIPGVEPPVPPPAPLVGLPGKTAPIPPAKETKAIVKVKAKHTVRHPPAPPPVTG